MKLVLEILFKSLYAVTVITLIASCSEPELVQRSNRPPAVTNLTLQFYERVYNQQVLATVSASDADADVLTFSIKEGNTNDAFGINSLGQLYVKNASFVDFETTQRFDLVVEVSDGKGGLATNMTFIDLLNVEHESIEPILYEKTAEQLTNEYEKKVIDYFKTIALGFEFGNLSLITRKWVSTMKIKVIGNPDPLLLQELDKIIKEINGLTSDGFNIEMATNPAEANFVIYFVPFSQYAPLAPGLDLVANWGAFVPTLNAANQLYGGHMYVDVTRANLMDSKHLLREELTQVLGLAQDSYQYPESIFQQSHIPTTQYSLLDKDLIRLLYHPDMAIGLNAAKVEETLKAIFAKE